MNYFASLTDQHGNILTTAATDADQCNEANTINNRPDDTFTSIETITTPNEQLTVKKQSRLKHFFSPIRKKSVVAQSPSVISQPDVFISNILPSNMYVNPAFHLPETIVKPEAVGETSSPTSSFQVTNYRLIIFKRPSDRFLLFADWRQSRRASLWYRSAIERHNEPADTMHKRSCRPRTIR